MIDARAARPPRPAERPWGRRGPRRARARRAPRGRRRRQVRRGRHLRRPARRLRLQPGAGPGGRRASRRCPASRSSSRRRCPETTDVQKTMGSMIEQDGATLLFPTSFGYFDPHILRMAEKYPKVRFAHCGGLWTEGKHPKNVGSYFGYIDECQYLDGIVAGHASKSKKLGFIAAKPIPQVLRNINAFTLGARSVDPKITDAAHHHRRLGAAGQGSGGGEQPDRPGRGRAHLPRRQPEGRRRDAPSAAASSSAAITPTRPRSRRRAT